MSTLDLINDWVARGELVQWLPQLSTIPIERKLFVSKEIMLLANGPWATKEHEKLSGQLANTFDRIVGGNLIMVSMEPFGHKTALMGLLYPECDGVWDVRIRDPKPGLRAFSGFADTDVLVSLIWRTRDQLESAGNGPQWQSAIRDFNTRWRNLFQPYTPVHTGDINDCISGNVHRI